MGQFPQPHCILKCQLGRMSNNISHIANRSSHHLMRLSTTQPGGPIVQQTFTRNPAGHYHVPTVAVALVSKEASNEVMEDAQLRV